MLEGFANIYEKKLQWCNENPEVPQFVYDILNHGTVREQCLNVCRELSNNAKAKHTEMLKEMVYKSQSASYTDDERGAYADCAERMHKLLEMYL